MSIALLSDIHGNLEAFEAVLADLARHKVEGIYCLGDVIGYGGDPTACLALTRKHCTKMLMGNHEFAVLGLIEAENMNEAAQESLAWTARQLGDNDTNYLADLEMSMVVDDCLLVHASPHDPSNWHYVLTRTEAARGFEAFSQQICFYGHTHVPMIFARADDGNIRNRMGHDFDPDEEARYLVNVGSVGQPRDDDPRACYVIYDKQSAAVTYHRVTYDIKKTQAKMTEAKLPRMLIERLEFGR